MAARDDLEAHAAERFELAEQRAALCIVELVTAGVRDHRDAACGIDPPHGVGERRPRVRHIAGLAFAEIRLEYRLSVFGAAALDEMAREVGAAHELGIGDVAARAFESSGYAYALELGRHALRALEASRARRAQTFDEHGVPGIDEESDDMHGVRPPRHRHFHAVDELDPFLDGGSACFGQPAELVVIGQREHADAALRRAQDELARAHRSVRVRRMAVQVVAADARRHALFWCRRLWAGTCCARKSIWSARMRRLVRIRYSARFGTYGR